MLARASPESERALALIVGPLLLSLAILYTLIAISDPWVPIAAARAMTPIDAALASVFGIGWLVANWRPPRRAHAVTAVIIAFCAATAAARIRMLDEPLLAVALLLAQLAAGSLLLAPRASIAAHGSIGVAWLAASGGAPLQRPWIPWTFVLLAGLAVSVALATGRARLFVAAQRDRRALEESEARHRALVGALPDGIVVLVDGCVTFANDAAARIFGAPSAEALVGTFGPHLVADESAEIIAARNRDVETAGITTRPIEVRARRLDGSLVDIEIWGLPVVYGGRQADLSIVRDLTERRRAQNEASLLAAATQEQAVTRDLVRRVLREMSGLAPGLSLRSLGRRLAKDIPAKDLRGHLRAFEAMGAGRLELRERVGDRYVLRGTDLLERRDDARQPTCSLALGFMEGAVGTLGSQAALGTETTCQSLGHPCCTFVIQARPLRSVVTTNPAGKRS